MSGLGDVAARARAWHHTVKATVCDVLEPWDHGTIVRATRYPSYFDFNVVRVEDDPRMGVDDLVAFADDALAGLDHRRVDIEPAGVEEVPFDAVNALRVAWTAEDFPDLELGDYLAEARDVAGILGAEILAVMDAGTPVAYAQVERMNRSAEIAQVYVRRDHRGRGLGTALTCAAIEAVRDVDELWIVADDEGGRSSCTAASASARPWTAVEMLRLPDRSAT